MANHQNVERIHSQLNSLTLCGAIAMAPQYMAVDADSVIHFDDETECALYCILRGMAFIMYSRQLGWRVIDCSQIEIEGEPL